MLVTNRHVIEGCKSASFSMTEREENGAPIFGNELTFDLPQELWKMHPNPEVDLAMAPIAPLINLASQSKKYPFFIPITPEIVADDNYLKNMDAIENILMVGYPTGIYDEVNNLPIIRKGITATRIGLKYNNRSEFLIDCACFPGSSGSPVFQYDTGPELTSDGNMSMGGVRFKFLGILWGGPTHNAEGEIVARAIETTVKPIPRTSVMINLGYCIRASELKEFEKVFEQEINSAINTS